MQIQRRQIVKALSSLPLLAFVGTLLAKVAEAAGIPANYKLALPGEGTAKILQYTDDAAKTNPATRTDKKATCKTCNQYAVTSKEFTHPTDGKVATCEILLNGSDKLFVKNPGWCISFQKRA